MEDQCVGETVPPVGDIRRTKPKFEVETLLALEIDIDEAIHRHYTFISLIMGLPSASLYYIIYTPLSMHIVCLYLK